MNTWIFIPTYNEEGNIGRLLDAVVKELPEARILVVDDNSRDKTVSIVKSRQALCPGIILLSREGSPGRGFAGAEGFNYALESGADCLLEMDADFSHDPRYIRDFLRFIPEYDMIIGSRRLGSGGIKGRGRYRDFVTAAARFFCRFFLGMRLTDPTSGYRCFSRRALESINWKNIVSGGPSIVGEINLLAQKKRLRIKEIPILFNERKAGRSKLNFVKLMWTFTTLIKIKFMIK